MSNEFQNWLWGKLGDRCVKNLISHGFDAVFVPDIDAARSLVLEMTSDYETFGFGGSDTTRRLGLVEALKAGGKTVFDHWQPELSKAADLDLRLQQGRCDCFMCSANAVSLQGEIVNVDGVGNRTNATTFGPKKVVIVAGMNKVTADLASALKRVQEIAAPMRAKSLGFDTPCAETGLCADCNSPQRICRVTNILHRRPMLTDISVVLVGQMLGF